MLKKIVLVLTGVSSAAYSQSVEYIFTGIGNGSIGGESFFETEFTISLSGDEVDIFTTSSGYDKFIDSNARVMVNGITDSVFFTTDISLVMNNDVNFLVLGSPSINRSLAIMNNEELMGYDLRGAFGPITDYELKGTNTFLDVPTEFGLLSISVMSELTYNAVPAPNALIVMIMGGGVVARRGHRR